MKKGSKDKNFIKKPTYDGGWKALQLFIKKELVYPRLALEKKTEGTVVLKYTINYKGEVIDVKVMKGLGDGCDEEAIRLVKLLKFKVAKTRNIKIQFHKSIQIHFKVPKKNKTTIKYTLITKKKENKDTGFNYTINIG